jgi:hypothetical protein
VRSSRTAPALAIAAALIVFLAVRAGQTGLPTGDEPHYLVIAQSLVEDGDLEVVDNYRSAHYLSYYGGLLAPHVSAASRSGRPLYSVHSPGVPALVAPGFWIDGYRGAYLTIALLVAVGTGFVWIAVFTLTESAAAAWFGWMSVALTAPLALHGTLIYPDPVAAALLAAGLAILAATDRRRATTADSLADAEQLLPWTAGQAACLGIAVAALPWLHTRLMLPAAMLAVIVVLRLVGSFGRNRRFVILVLAFIVPLLVGVASWLALFKYLYGTFNPATVYGGQFPLELSQIAVNLLALASDQEYGLVPNAPVHLLWAAGLWFLFKRNRRFAIELLIVVVPYAVACSGFSMWWGGGSPPGRFLVPIVLPMGLLAGVAWNGLARSGRVFAAAVLVLSILIMAVLAFGGDGTLAYPNRIGRAPWLEWLTPLVDLPNAFPSYFKGARPTLAFSGVFNELIVPAAIWCGSLFLGWLSWRTIARKAPSPPSAALAVSACLVLAVSIGVHTVWKWRGGPQRLATRSQLELLRREYGAGAFGVRFSPPAVLPLSSVPSTLAIGTSRLDTPPPDTVLWLDEVPAGEYLLQVRRRQFARGELTLRVGAGSLPVERWSLAEGGMEAARFTLPITVGALSVVGNEDGVRSIRRVALVPIRRIIGGGLAELRARDGGRYGSKVVYVTDDRAWIDGEGLWLAGGRQAQILVVDENAAGQTIDLEVRNIDVPNRVHLGSGAWSAERTLSPDETWRIGVPKSPNRALAITLETENGTDKSGRFVGALVTVR